MNIPSYTIAVVGAAGVGKTNYLNRLARGAFCPQWRESHGCEIRQMEFNTPHGPCRVNFKEYAGADYNDEVDLSDVDAVIYMYDVTSRVSLKILNRSRVAGKPAILMANKVDIKVEDHKVFGEPTHSASVDFAEMSCKSATFDYTEPVIRLLGKLAAVA